MIIEDDGLSNSTGPAPGHRLPFLRRSRRALVDAQLPYHLKEVNGSIEGGHSLFQLCLPYGSCFHEFVEETLKPFGRESVLLHQFRVRHAGSDVDDYLSGVEWQFGPSTGSPVCSGGAVLSVLPVPDPTSSEQFVI